MYNDDNDVVVDDDPLLLPFEPDVTDDNDKDNDESSSSIKACVKFIS